MFGQVKLEKTLEKIVWGEDIHREKEEGKYKRNEWKKGVLALTPL